MKLPKIVGKLVYFFGYPLFRILIKNTNRAYVAIYYQDKILLTKNWLGFQKKWRLPGGGIKNGEKPIDAVLRELQEEVGIAINIKNIIPLTNKPLRSKFNYNYWLFEVTLNEYQDINIDQTEILEAKFIKIKNLYNYYVSEEVNKVLGLTKKQ